MLSGNSLVNCSHPSCLCSPNSKIGSSPLKGCGGNCRPGGNGSLPPGLWLTSPAGWLPRTGISSGTLRSVIEYGMHKNWRREDMQFRRYVRRHTDRQTNRQTDIHADRHTDPFITLPRSPTGDWVTILAMLWPALASSEYRHKPPRRFASCRLDAGWYIRPVVDGNVGDYSVGSYRLKHNSWPTPHPSVICVELLGGIRQPMTGRFATHPSNTTVRCR